LLPFDVKIIKRVKKGLEEILTLEETAKYLKIYKWQGKVKSLL